jgi:hypothetical protein
LRIGAQRIGPVQAFPREKWLGLQAIERRLYAG